MQDADDLAVNPEAVGCGDEDKDYVYLCDGDFDEIDIGYPNVYWSIIFDVRDITWMQDYSKVYCEGKHTADMDQERKLLFNEEMYTPENCCGTTQKILIANHFMVH